VKLRTKLLVWYSGLFFLFAALCATTMYAVIAHKMRIDFLHYLADEYDSARGMTQVGLSEFADLERDLRIEVASNRYFPMSYRLYDARRQEDVLVLAPLWREALPETPDLSRVGDDPVQIKVKVGERARDIAYFMIGPVDDDENAHLILQLGMSYKRVYKRLHKMRELLLGTLIFSVLLSLAGGWFVASRSLRPVDGIASSLERIEAESLSERLSEEGPADEIMRIATSINRMLGRLEEAFTGMRNFTADAAHELRTPLAALKCRLDVAARGEHEVQEYERVIEDALREVNELGRLVNELLLLANLDAHDRPERVERVDLPQLLKDIGEVFEVLASEKGLELVLEGRSPCCVQGNPQLLRRLFSNLIENAILYTPSDGRVGVAVSTQGDECVVTVTDTGVGIKHEDMDRIFERFFRVEESRRRGAGGSGLGLSICKRIAELHGGRISVESHSGVGTVFTVCMPLCTE